MQTRTQVVATMLAGALALGACASEDPATDTTEADLDTTTSAAVDTTPADTTETTGLTDTTPATSADTTAPDATGDTSAAGATFDLDAIDDRFEALGDQVEATGNDAVTDAWDDLERRYEDVRDSIESGDLAGLSVEDMNTALESFSTTVEENADQLDPALQDAWDELMADIQTGIAGVSG